MKNAPSFLINNIKINFQILSGEGQEFVKINDKRYAVGKINKNSF